jgi:hypothetical protein
VHHAVELEEELEEEIIDEDDEAGLTEVSSAGGYSVEEDDGVTEWQIERRHINYLNFVPLATCLEVEVPTEMFAKDYPEWIRKIVRRFYPIRDKDQCQFKRRAIYCIGWVAAILTFGLIVKPFCALVGAFFGIRSERWRDMIKPIQGSLFGPLASVESSFWFWNKKEGDFRDGNPIMLFNPVVAFVPAGVVFGLMQFWALMHVHLHHAGTNYPGWWGTLWMVDLAILCLVAYVVIVVLACIGIAYLFKVSDTFQGIVKKFDEGVSKKLGGRVTAISTWLDARYQRRLKELVCDNQPQVVSYEAIPWAKRSLKLRYDNTKAKHCKPFAQ